MDASQTYRLRVTYSLDNRLSLLSHLETARTLERLVRRADLPFCVTEGFSPHMKIAFGSALPVGVGGDAEIFDVFLSRYIPADECLRKLRASTPADIGISACAYVEPKARAASVAFPVSVYHATLARPLDELKVPSTIEVTRKKKHKVIEVSDHLVGPVDVNGADIRFSLRALPTGSLRPDLFLDACLKETYAPASCEHELHEIESSHPGPDDFEIPNSVVSIRRTSQAE